MYKYIFQILLYFFIFYFYKVFYNILSSSFNYYNTTDYYTSRYYEYDSRAIRILLI